MLQLAPGDQQIVDQHQRDIDAAKKFAQKLTIVSLTGDKKDDKEEKEKEKIDVCLFFF